MNMVFQGKAKKCWHFLKDINVIDACFGAHCPRYLSAFSFVELLFEDLCRRKDINYIYSQVCRRQIPSLVALASQLATDRRSSPNFLRETTFTKDQNGTRCSTNPVDSYNIQHRVFFTCFTLGLAELRASVLARMWTTSSSQCIPGHW